MSTYEGQTVLITGVSSGIGHALAQYYLNSRARVLSLSRRTPEDLVGQDGFIFVSVDLDRGGEIDDRVALLLAEVRQIDLVVLNAGVLGRFGDLRHSEAEDLRRTMQVNVWANVTLLNAIYSHNIIVKQVVAISSGASVNGNRGLSGYSVSKAALNMMIKLYSREQGATHFCAFAPGLVDTAMQDTLCGQEPDERYPALEVLRVRRGTPEMPTPVAAAPVLADAMRRLPDLVGSGEYADIRNLPLA